jgi:hypothetical protein
MKSLAVIQTLAKIGRVVSKVLLVCCIVGFCLCLTGVVSLALGAETFKLGGVTVHSMIENSAEWDLPAVYASLIVGMVFCAADSFLCKAAVKYFQNELADGTPFTLRGARELMHLGILTAAVSLGAVILCSIGLSAANNVFPGVDKIPLDEYSSVGVGVAMIVLSLFCRCGAEQLEEKTERPEPVAEQEE